MRDVSIIGVGQVPVGERWDAGAAPVGAERDRAALQDAGLQQGGRGDRRQRAGRQPQRPKSRRRAGGGLRRLRGVEAVHVEAADASGGLALRHGTLMIASGAADVVLVVASKSRPTATGSERDNGAGDGA